MAADVREPEVPALDRRAHVARLQLRLRQARRRLAEVEDVSLSDPEAARAALIAELVPALDQRRLSMDAELATARAAADRRRDEAERAATEIVERAEQTVRGHVHQAARDQAARDQAARDQAARDQAARDQAVRDQAVRDQAVREQAAQDQAAREQAAREQAAREQAAREQAAREQAAREQAAREQAAREQAAREQAAREQAAREQAAREQAARVVPTARPVLPPELLPIVQIVDGPVGQEDAVRGAATTHGTPSSPHLAPTGLAMNDPEVFARAVATVLAAVVGERGATTQHVDLHAQPKAGFWASARHLDVLLLGFTTVIVLVVLAAWLA